MDVRSSSLVVVLYLLLGVTSAAVVGLAFAFYQTSSENALLKGLDSDLASAPPRPAPIASTAYLEHRKETFGEAAARIRQLEKILERKTELLDKKNELLQRKTREYEALKKETDDYFRLAMELIEQPPKPDENGDPTPTSPPSIDAAKVEAERLRAELQRTELLEGALETQLDELRGELEAARQQLAEQELNRLLADPATPVATQALVRLGPQAVPVLVEALRDEQADIRLWSASVLEALGPRAATAVDSLNAMRRDTDPRVRTAVQRALAAINP